MVLHILGELVSSPLLSKLTIWLPGTLLASAHESTISVAFGAQPWCQPGRGVGSIKTKKELAAPEWLLRVWAPPQPVCVC